MVYQKHTQSGPRRRPPGYNGRLLERLVEDALRQAYWVVVRESQADHHSVDFVVRNNLRIIQIPRPILIQTTSYLGNRDKFLRFLHRARQAFGELNVFLYIEAETTERDGSEYLVFDELAVQSAMGNIVSFFKQPTDPSVFLLRLTEAKHRFKVIRDPEADFDDSPKLGRGVASKRPESSPAIPETRTEPAAGASRRELRTIPRPARRPEGGIRSQEDANVEPQEGMLTAWKCCTRREEEFGWIMMDGKQFHAGATVWSQKDLDFVREQTNTTVNDKGWGSPELRVSFREEPPYPGERWPRAIGVRLL